MANSSTALEPPILCFFFIKMLSSLQRIKCTSTTEKEPQCVSSMERCFFAECMLLVSAVGAYCDPIML